MWSVTTCPWASVDERGERAREGRGEADEPGDEDEQATCAKAALLSVAVMPPATASTISWIR